MLCVKLLYHVKSVIRKQTSWVGSLCSSAEICPYALRETCFKATAHGKVAVGRCEVPLSHSGKSLDVLLSLAVVVLSPVGLRWILRKGFRRGSC